MAAVPRRQPGGRSSAGRAPGCGPGGRGFESRRSPSGKPPQRGASGQASVDRLVGGRSLPRGSSACGGVVDLPLPLRPVPLDSGTLEIGGDGQAGSGGPVPETWLMNPMAISPLQTEKTYREARAELSVVV